jgi:predicted ATP-grasp superfamily ATP-dependent carboligase
MYAGGLENHPKIVARISAARELWGNPAGTLRLARDPWRVAALLREAGLPWLDVWPRGKDAPPPDESWMRKPRHGSAGRGIAVWGRTAHTANLRSTGPKFGASTAHYFQRRNAGVPHSAVFVAFPGETMLAGVTRQLIGLKDVGAPPFAWCGSIAPVDLPPDTLQTIRRIGATLAARLGLRGTFGCDFLIENAIPWLTEINPRYTASVEILEHLHRVSLIDWHRRACEGEGAEYSVRSTQCAVHGGPLARTVPDVLGKVVLYADADVVAGDARSLLSIGGVDQWPVIADVPAPGQEISRGQPVCTLFGRGSTIDECLARLIENAARFCKDFTRIVGEIPPH